MADRSAQAGQLWWTTGKRRSLPLGREPLSDPLPVKRIALAHDTGQRLSKAAPAFIETARAWVAAHDVFTA